MYIKGYSRIFYDGSIVLDFSLEHFYDVRRKIVIVARVIFHVHRLSLQQGLRTRFNMQC